jgi:hypothetical protein
MAGRRPFHKLEVNASDQHRLGQLTLPGLRTKGSSHRAAGVSGQPSAGRSRRAESCASKGDEGDDGGLRRPLP